jgi:integrase
VFPGRFQGRRSTEYFRKHFKRVCKRLNIRSHPHALRHTFAHLMLEHGNAVDVISRLLNHTDRSITEKHYLRESAADVARRTDLPWLPAPRPAALLPDFLRPSPRIEQARQVSDFLSIVNHGF